MELLISLYDNVLIYYPNIFFAALFLFLFLICIFVLQVTMYVSRLGLAKTIKSHKYDLSSQKVNIINGPIIVTEKIINGIAHWLRKIEILTEKIIKKIGKEILIDEKK